MLYRVLDSLEAPVYLSHANRIIKTIRSQRLLDSIPALWFISAFVICLLGAVLFPIVLMTWAAFLALYALIRFVFIGVAAVRGLAEIERWQQIDWYAEYAHHSNPLKLDWQVVHHLVIIPNYAEPLCVLERSLQALAASPQARCMTVVLAMEAIEPKCEAKAQALQAQFQGSFCDLIYTVHPSDLINEIQCKSANQHWAVRRARRHLVEQRGVQPQHIVVTTMDADTCWHPDYFSALTYQFCTDESRYQRFWQAPIRYHGNIYDVSPLLRLVNVYTTTTELAYLVANWWQSLPISSYSLSMKLLDSVSYWDGDVIADEWHMYIKAFFAHHGRVTITPIFLPFLANVVSGDTLWDTVKNRYRQTVRHAWGSKEIGYTVSQIMSYPQIPLRKSLPILISTAHDLLLSSGGWIFLTVGAQLPLLLHPHLLLQTPNFLVMQFVGVVMTIFGVTMLYLDRRTWPERKTEKQTNEVVLSVLGFVCLPVFGFLFVILPVFQAQIMLLLGKQLHFQVTSKQ